MYRAKNRVQRLIIGGMDIDSDQLRFQRGDVLLRLLEEGFRKTGKVERHMG